jgi:mono/diheme cytochrome c family protein
MRVLLLGITAGLAMALTATPADAQAPDGRSVYRSECKVCHGITGVPPKAEKAKYKKLRALGDSGFVSSLSRDSIVTIVTKGIDKNMKSFSDKLTEAEILAVSIYIKELAEKNKAS